MRRTRGATASITVGIVVIIIGIIMVITSLIAPESRLVTPNENIPYSSSNVYDMGEVLVIDKYGSVEYSRGLDENYYLIAYYVEEDDNAHLASLQVTEGTEIFEKLDEYVNDDTLYIGDFFIELCAKAAPVSELDSDIISYYNEAVDMCGNYFTGTVDSEISLTFYCENAEDFPSALRSEERSKTVVTVIGSIAAILGVICLVTGIIKKKKENAAKAVLQQQNPYYYPPNQPNVYYNPQSNQQPVQNQWTNGAPSQPSQPYTGNNTPNQQPQAGGTTPFQQQDGESPDNANNTQNQYYQPPTKNDSDNINAPENGAANNEQ